MNVGQINNLKVLRKTNIGYVLINNDEDQVFMHFKETDIEHNDNDMIDVFIYFDKQGRIAATTNEPSVTLDKPGFIRVKDINEKIGVFLDNNCAKDLILSEMNLPKSYDNWPQIDDTIPVKIKVKETNLSSRLMTKDDILEINCPRTKYEVGDTVKAYVCKFTTAGIGLVTMDYNYIFVHITQVRKKVRLGGLYDVRILQVRENEYGGSLNEVKENLVDTDSMMIIDYLKANNGFMHFTGKTSSDEIEETFKMSRKAFKRALGNLYKERTIDIKDDGTYLLEQDI